jgi:hypothetical protein
MRTPILRRFPWILGFVLGACIGDHGGGSDTETLTGTVLSSGGTPLAGARVKLFPSDHDPRQPAAAPRIALTDAAGGFRFQDMPPAARYNLLAGDAPNGWAFAESLRVDTGSHTLTLASPRTFLVTLLGDVYPSRDTGWVSFPGTDILAHCDGVAATRIDSIPHGVRRIVVESNAGWSHDTVLVNIGDTLRIEANRQGVICQTPKGAAGSHP